MGFAGTVRAMLEGGLAVDLPSNADDPEGKLLARTMIQMDGDVLTLLDRNFAQGPPAEVAEALSQHLADVQAAIKPLESLKKVVAWVSEGVAAICGGITLGTVARAALDPTSGGPDPWSLGGIAAFIGLVGLSGRLGTAPLSGVVGGAMFRFAGLPMVR
ncbi:MAG: hypothetical protein AAF439_15620, partial [Pseudomonadota bacterium]